jgi:hypothetical protein
MDVKDDQQIFRFLKYDESQSDPNREIFKITASSVISKDKSVILPYCRDKEDK